MLSFLAKKLLPKRNSVYSFKSSSVIIRSISTNSTTHPNNSFTISYLINSCGFSEEQAKSVSKKVHLKSPTNPDSVLTLLRDHGFSNSHISKICVCYPRILLANADKTLKPKFDFFNSKGLSGPDLAKVVSRESNVLNCSLEKAIIPTFDLLKSIVGTDEKVTAILRRSMDVLRLQSQKILVLNIAFLRAHGVPDANVVKLLVSQPRVILRNPSRFSENVMEVKKMNSEPSKYKFLVAVHAWDAMSRSSLEAKFDVFKGWGWSDDQVREAFRNYPQCMMLSEENIMSTMDFFVTKMGYSGSSIANRPVILLYSLEKRIIPRCSVIQVLIKKGCVKKLPNIRTVLYMTEDAFLKSFITKFEKTVPGLLNFYKGKSQ